MAMVLIHTAVLFLWFSAQTGMVEFTAIGQGGNSQIEESREVVVRTAGEWSTLWKQHAGAARPPSIDFTRAIVIAVFLGSRPTAGYRVEITRLEKQDEALVVSYRELRPGADDMVAQMLTTPFHLVQTGSHRGPVKFQRTP
jgi:hypothetical protein